MVRRNFFNMRTTILQNVKPKKDKYSVKDVEKGFLNWFKNVKYKDGLDLEKIKDLDYNNVEIIKWTKYYFYKTIQSDKKCVKIYYKNVNSDIIKKLKLHNLDYFYLNLNVPEKKEILSHSIEISFDSSLFHAIVLDNCYSHFIRNCDFIFTNLQKNLIVSLDGIEIPVYTKDHGENIEEINKNYNTSLEYLKTNNLQSIDVGYAKKRVFEYYDLNSE